MKSCREKKLKKEKATEMKKVLPSSSFQMHYRETVKQWEKNKRWMRGMKRKSASMHSEEMKKIGDRGERESSKINIRNFQLKLNQIANMTEMFWGKKKKIKN